MAVVQLAQNCFKMEVAKLICRFVHGGGNVLERIIKYSSEFLNGKETTLAQIISAAWVLAT